MDECLGHHKLLGSDGAMKFPFRMDRRSVEEVD